MTAFYTLTQAIQHLLGNAYSWDAQSNELQYLGHPLSDYWQTEHEKQAVQQALACQPVTLLVGAL